MKTLYMEELGGDQVSDNVTITSVRLYNITQAFRLHVCDAGGLESGSIIIPRIKIKSSREISFYV